MRASAVAPSGATRINQRNSFLSGHNLCLRYARNMTRRERRIDSRQKNAVTRMPRIIKMRETIIFLLFIVWA